MGGGAKKRNGVRGGGTLSQASFLEENDLFHRSGPILKTTEASPWGKDATPTCG